MLSCQNPFRFFSIHLTWGWLGFFALVPIFLLVITSLLLPGDNELLRLQFSLDNYLTLLNKAYLYIFYRSFLMATACTLICLLLAYPFSYILTRMPKNTKAFWLLLMIIPFWTSSLIRCYALIALLKIHGLINNLLLWFGLINTPIQLMYTNLATIIGLVYTLLPLMIVPLYANLEKLDLRLIDAAKDLGATKWQIFIKIIIPLSLPGIFAGCLLVFLPAMTIFYIPDLLGGAKTMLLGNVIQNQFLAARNWPMGATISIALILLMGICLFIYWRRYPNKQELL